MERNVTKGELFATFSFDGKDSADMGVISMSQGARYTYNLEPTYSDQTLTVPGYDGNYYYGSQITGQSFVFNCYADGLTLQEYDALRSWLAPRKLGRLILADQPYKYYNVKVSSITTLNLMPRTTTSQIEYSRFGDMRPGDPLYGGEFTVTFSTVGSAYGLGMTMYREDLIYDAKDHGQPDNYYYDGGLLYRDMSPKLNWFGTITTGDYFKLPIYNPGDLPCSPLLHITSEHADAKLTFTNNTNGTTCTVDLTGLASDCLLNFRTQSVISNNKTYYGRMTGTILTVNGHRNTIFLPDSISVYNEIGQYPEFIEEISFTVVSNLVEVNPRVLEVSDALVGRYFCTNSNHGAEIVGVNIEDNSLMLSDETFTEDIPPANPSTGRPAGIEYRFIPSPDGEYPPSTGRQKNDVSTNDGTNFYLWNGESWVYTNLFTDDKEFKNVREEYIPIYLTFGATILELDDLGVISRSGNRIMSMTATLEPKYL